MYYAKGIYNAEALGKLVYGFKVNMLCEKLEITYDNFGGGYTTKGIKLNMNKYILFLDHYSWNLQCISNDENPMLEIPDGGGYYIMPPNSMINLMEYIINIGMEFENFERMRLF